MSVGSTVFEKLVEAMRNPVLDDALNQEAAQMIKTDVNKFEDKARGERSVLC
jgi:ubiquitin-protein ligase